MTNTAWSQTQSQSVEGIYFVFAGLSLPWKRIFKFVKKCMWTISTGTNIFCKLFKGLACQTNLTPRKIALRGVEFFKLKIRISLRERISEQHLFSLLIRGLVGLIHWKCQTILWHCHFKPSYICAHAFSCTAQSQKNVSKRLQFKEDDSALFLGLSYLVSPLGILWYTNSIFWKAIVPSLHLVQNLTVSNCSPYVESCPNQ